MFSLGNQLVSSAIREKNQDSKVKQTKKNLCVISANVAINTLEKWEHKTGTSTSQSTTPQMERGRHKGRDSGREETGKRRVRNTDHHVTSNIKPLNPHRVCEV